MLEILYEDKWLMVCHKPGGVPAQSDRSFDVDMVSAILKYLREKNEDMYCGVINRLDKPVSGIMLFAKKRDVAATLSAKQDYCKKYLAVVTGAMEESEGTFTDYLIRDGRTNTSRVAKATEKDSKKSVLHYKVIKTFTQEEVEYSLVEVTLETGRHHQIRVQFASRGHGLYGDRKYNPEGKVCGETILHYAHMNWNLSILKREKEFILRLTQRKAYLEEYN